MLSHQFVTQIERSVNKPPVNFLTFVFGESMSCESIDGREELSSLPTSKYIVQHLGIVEQRKAMCMFGDVLNRNVMHSQEG